MMNGWLNWYAGDRDKPARRFVAVGRAVRAWALAHPAEWDLLFGRPVPGYVAPEDARQPALRLPAVLIGILRDGRRLGLLTAPPVRPGRALLAQAEALRQHGETDLPATLVALSQAAWSQLIGAVTHEVSGQASFVLADPEPLFELQLRQIILLMGFKEA